MSLSDADRRRLLALDGAYPIGASPEEIARRFDERITRAPVAFLEKLANDEILTKLVQPWPGRSEALLALARRLGCALPESEYSLPEDRLETLLARARASSGRRLRLRGAARHKGRVGDAVERLLVGKTIAGKHRDHPAAEIKSVPVSGDRVIERVKLGVLSATSDPLTKCDRVLFVFVEQRGHDHFVRGHRLVDLDRARFAAMWRDGFLVETAAGSPRFPARGLYLTPKWFRSEGLWPG
jgi:hypothetical protein